MAVTKETHNPGQRPWFGRPDAEQALETTAPAAALFVLRGPASTGDFFGYAVSDRLLSAFAQRLLRQAPAGRPIYRWSGTALLVLLAGAWEWDAARWLPERFVEPVELDGRSIQVPVSARADLVELPRAGAAAAARLIDYRIALLVGA